VNKKILFIFNIERLNIIQLSNKAQLTIHPTSTTKTLQHLKTIPKTTTSSYWATCTERSRSKRNIQSNITKMPAFSQFPVLHRGSCRNDWGWLSVMCNCRERL